ncbi:MAG: right-handed parallel beta-helix repeat-containing protein, partial [Bacteroidales bacterium]
MGKRWNLYAQGEDKDCSQAECHWGARIKLWGYPGERVIIDGSQIVTNSVSEFKMARCIYVNHEANYWHFKNLELCNAKDNGMKLEGSYHIVENCKFYGNNDTGLQIGMYKDFSIEETKSLPPGTPEFNPDYQFCKYNVVINCDAYHNYDSKSFAGTDDGGDADGFAAKLFPGPGTEFHGCRAWNNSDDNWDLYMVYHPIVINECWAWKGGYDHNNVARGNGNGFKLGGGGSAGGAAFSQSVGAHLVTNCVAFDNLEKGFDQNNAYEGMYLFNNIAWNNKYNYRFPTIFQYGGMYMRNNIGWGAKASGNVGNHEFLSADKAGSILPDTEFNSWTLIDGCDPYKENNRVDGVRVPTKDHSAQFKSLAVELAMAERGVDGSLPENDFCRLVTGSYFVDKGQNIEN